MSSLTEQMLNLAAAFEQLEQERDELARRLFRLEAIWPDKIRGSYRRGYLAGRSAQRRGAPAVTNPERSARGWVREAVRAQLPEPSRR